MFLRHINPVMSFNAIHQPSPDGSAKSLGIAQPVWASNPLVSGSLSAVADRTTISELFTLRPIAIGRAQGSEYNRLVSYWNWWLSLSPFDKLRDQNITGW